jgi:hypothetical protein
VGLVHLTYNESPMELKLSELANLPINQPSLTVLVSASQSSALNATSLNSLVQSVQSGNGSPTNNNNESPSSSSPRSSAAPPTVLLVNQSDSIIQTLLSLLTKKDLINEHSSKYLVQYFQFFNYYLSLGLQQVRLVSNKIVFF